MIDYGGLPPEALDPAVDHSSAGWKGKGRTYVHCRAGWQRSAAVAAGVVALRDGMEIDEALAERPAAQALRRSAPPPARDLRAGGTDAADPVRQVAPARLLRRAQAARAAAPRRLRPSLVVEL